MSDRNRIEGYVDIHCHIIPDCDDGAEDLQASIDMAKMAYDNGTRHIIATPHTWDGMYINQRNKVVEQCKLLQNELDQRKIDVHIYPGNEIHIHTDFIDTYRSRETTSLADKGKYVLLELPFPSIPSFLMDLIYEIRLLGIVPIIPHPERYIPVQDTPSIVYEWVKEGALTQVTAASIYGRLGENSRKCAEILVKHGLVHMIASDGHNCRSRKPKLQNGYQALEQWIGVDGVYSFETAAMNALIGESIIVPEPIPIKKRKFWIF